MLEHVADAFSLFLSIDTFVALPPYSEKRSSRAR